MRDHGTSAIATIARARLVGSAGAWLKALNARSTRKARSELMALMRMSALRSCTLKASRSARRAYQRQYWFVVAPDGPARLTRSCGHKHLAVREAHECLGQRPGERIYLVRSDEMMD